MDLYKRLTDFRRELADIAARESSCLTPGNTVDPHVLDVIEDELLPALELVEQAIDFDPTPNHLYDPWGGEPPLSADERWQAAHAEHVRLHS